jgi:hypothetical protein
MAFDEARFGLTSWHRRRYCPRGFRPPYVVRRAYKWTYLYAAVEPTTGESFCLYLPGMDDICLEVFLDELSKTYPNHHLLIVLDGAPSHRSEQITRPENVSLIMLPPTPQSSTRRRGGFRSSGGSYLTGRSRRSRYCKRRSAEHSGPTGRIPPASKGLPVSPGGWRPSMRCDINNPEQY